MNVRVRELRKSLSELLSEYEKKKKNKESHIKLDISTELLEKVIFEEEGSNDNEHRVLAISMDLLKYVDLTGISFKNVNIKGVILQEVKEL